MNIAIAGLGLIGGSFAKAASRRTTHRVTGHDLNPATVAAALRECAIAESGAEIFRQADLILVALFPADTIRFINENIANFRQNALVIDLCGVKRAVCDGVARAAGDSGAIFIGGHPMAGMEKFGYQNSRENLFDKASMILTPPDGTPDWAVKIAGDFFLSLGFGHIEITTPDRHDEMIAYTSQLAHVVSSAYVRSPVVRDWRGFSAGSFKDMTRVARLNEDMWSELFLANGGHLSDQLEVIIDNLRQFRQLIAARDKAGLTALLRQGREIKEQLETEESPL